MWRIEFSSDKFLPLLPEDCQANPGVYGFELAWWLAQALAKHGAITGYPLGEDWGWFIEYTDAKGAEFSICCSSMAEVDEGYTGNPIQWAVFIKAYTSLKDRLKGESHSATVENLARLIVSALAAEHISVDQSAA